MAALLIAAAAWLTTLQPVLRPPWIEMEGTCPTCTGGYFSRFCSQLEGDEKYESYSLAMISALSSSSAARTCSQADGDAALRMAIAISTTTAAALMRWLARS